MELHAVMLSCVQKWVSHQPLFPKAGRQRSMIKTPSLPVWHTKGLCVSPFCHLRPLFYSSAGKQLSSPSPWHLGLKSPQKTPPGTYGTSGEVGQGTGKETGDNHKALHLPPGILEPQLPCKHHTALHLLKPHCSLTEDLLFTGNFSASWRDCNT